MRTSAEQFTELMSHAIARFDRMLATGGDVFPLGLLLLKDGRVDVSVAAFERTDQIPGLVGQMQAAFAGKAGPVGAVASCIAYPDPAAGDVVVFLENDENYCVKYRIPVARPSGREFDLAGVVEEDGVVVVFPLADG